MRWTKVAILLLVIVLLGMLAGMIYPFAAPLLARHQLRGIIPVILTGLITSHPQTFVESAYPWVILGVIFLMYSIVSYDLKTRRSRTHGSAHHAGRREVRTYRAPRMTVDVQRLSQALTFLVGRGLTLFIGRGRAARRAFSLRLGWYRGGEIELSEREQYQHVLLTAPTGAGKSARVFLPNLLREMGTRSLFIGDLKNELYAVTAGWLAQHMQIWLFAPLRRDSQGYNPLAHIKSVEDAQDFAEAWVANTGSGGKDGEFWTNNARLLITAMTLHLLATEQAPALARLADVLTTSSFEEIHDLLRTTRSLDARRLARQFLENMAQNERLVGSVLTDVGVCFQLLASSRACAVTATNDLDFQEMISTPTAFFLTIPRPEVRRYRPLLAVLTMQMFTAWERRGTSGIGCYLDEFTNLGHIPGYADFISTARSLKVSLLMAIQNFSQLDERYGKNDANTIKANAVTHLLLPGAGLEETKYYSERIGDTTVPTHTVNRRGSGLSEEVTTSEGEARRRLMTPDELRTLPANEMLMIEAKSAPLILKTKLYFEERGLAERANLPYQQATRTHRQASPAPAPNASPRSSRTLPPTASPSTGKTAAPPPIVVEADQEGDSDDSFFQQE